MGTRRAGIAASATALALLVVPTMAGEFNPLGDGSGTNNADLTRDATADCDNCRATPPYEWGDAPFDLDWSLGLRGGITDDGSEQTYQLIALPSFTLRHETIRGGYDVGLKGELTYDLKLEPLGLLPLSQVAPPPEPQGGAPQLGPGQHPGQHPGQSGPPPQLGPGPGPMSGGPAGNVHHGAEGSGTPPGG